MLIIKSPHSAGGEFAGDESRARAVFTPLSHMPRLSGRQYLQKIIIDYDVEINISKIW